MVYWELIGLYICPRDMHCDLPEASFVKFLHLVISQKKNNKISANGNKGLSNAMVIQLGLKYTKFRS